MKHQHDLMDIRLREQEKLTTTEIKAKNKKLKSLQAQIDEMQNKIIKLESELENQINNEDIAEVKSNLNTVGHGARAVEDLVAIYAAVAKFTSGPSVTQMRPEIVIF